MLTAWKRVIGDPLRCVTSEQQNTSDAVSAELEQHCVEEGSAPYFKQRFWFFLSNRAMSGFEAAA